MSDDTHHTFSKAGAGPKRFTCGRRNREQWYTRDEKLVDCQKCIAKLKEKRSNAARERSTEEK